MRNTIILSFGFMLTGCIATQDRPMNYGERTIVSDEVQGRLDASPDGLLDTRQHSDIRCRRYKLVGTHMVTRYCYTSREEEEMIEGNRDKMYDRFGKQVCLDRTLGGPCNQI